MRKREVILAQTLGTAVIPGCCLEVRPSLPDGAQRDCLRRSGRQDRPDGSPEPSQAPDTATEERQAIVCAACGFEITGHDAAIEVDGSHQHAFFNPAGILFEIGCYRAAPGCLDAGVPSDEFSWFPGYAWRFSMCRACGTHLGWAFVSAGGDDVFWGLILIRLAGGV